MIMWPVAPNPEWPTDITSDIFNFFCFGIIQSPQNYYLLHNIVAYNIRMSGPARTDFAKQTRRQSHSTIRNDCGRFDCAVAIADRRSPIAVQTTDCCSTAGLKVWSLQTSHLVNCNMYIFILLSLYLLTSRFAIHRHILQSN